MRTGQAGKELSIHLLDLGEGTIRERKKDQETVIAQTFPGLEMNMGKDKSAFQQTQFCKTITRGCRSC